MIISSKYEKEDLSRGPLFLSLFFFKLQILPINILISSGQQILIRILGFPADNSQVCEVQTVIPGRIGIGFSCMDIFQFMRVNLLNVVEFFNSPTTVLIGKNPMKNDTGYLYPDALVKLGVRTGRGEHGKIIIRKSDLLTYFGG